MHLIKNILCGFSVASALKLLHIKKNKKIPELHKKNMSKTFFKKKIQKNYFNNAE